jgi:hypothetical protein
VTADVAPDRGVMLITTLLQAPLIGVDFESDDEPFVMHAVESAQIIDAWETKSATAACGATGLKLLKIADEPVVYEWPPSTRNLPRRYARCAACHDATGRRRPRSRWLSQPAAISGGAR